jgi:tight adherence protein C
MALAGALLIEPPMALVVALGWWGLPRWRRRRDAARFRWEVVAGLPEAADLLALAVGGGLTVPLALSTAARWSTGPVGAALREADRRVALGARTVDVLEALPARLGDPVRPLAAALLASERYGAPLAESLDRVAREARLERRRGAEERARRVPVLLLFPLVLCVLPAFALLTVVPLLVGSLPHLPR